MNAPSISFEEWNAQLEINPVSIAGSIAEKAAEDHSFRASLFEALAAGLDHKIVIEELLSSLLDDNELVELAVKIAAEIDGSSAVQAVIECAPQNQQHPLVNALGQEYGIVEWIAEEYTADDWRGMHSEGECEGCSHDMDDIVGSAEAAIEELQSLIRKAQD